MPGRLWRPTGAVLVALAAVAAVAGCSSVQMGAAAVTSSGRITAAALDSQVSNLQAAYQVDAAKGLRPQRATDGEPQQVLSWLLLFKVWDKVAVQRGLRVTAADTQKARAGLAAQARSQHVTLPDYVSTAGAVPPSQIGALSRYFAITTALTAQLDGGKTPTSKAGQAALQKAVGRAQCLAAKALAIRVNPQFGQYDYASYMVVRAPSSLAAGPSGPAKTASSVRLSPPC